jgi:hypothetical protein
MPAPKLTPEQRAKVNAWMAAFRYGEKVDDLGKVDDRHSSGRYDEVTWHISLDGATQHGGASLFRQHLVHAVLNGADDAAAEKYAYNMTAADMTLDGDPGYQFPEWAEAPA